MSTGVADLAYAAKNFDRPVVTPVRFMVDTKLPPTQRSGSSRAAMKLSTLNRIELVWESAR